MDRSQTWREALADADALTYWAMSDGAEFWLRPDRSLLLPDRHSDAGTRFADIRTVTAFSECHLGGHVYRCDWSMLRDRLPRISGLVVRPITVERIRGGVTPGDVWELTV